MCFNEQCKNGTCLCVTGWNGLHCTLEGCPGQCSGHGGCVAGGSGGFGRDEEREWSCDCEEGWEGEDCSVKMEVNCDDQVDNDGGKFIGTIDCGGKYSAEHKVVHVDG